MKRVKNNSKNDLNLYDFVLYVLECGEIINPKYYVGISTNFNRRYQEHLNEKGSNFTKKNKVISVIYLKNLGKTTWGTAEIMENYKVLELATKYGHERVGGGSFKKFGSLRTALNKKSNPYKK